MRQQPGGQITAALTELKARDERTAQHAEAALSSLTRGEGLETITQHGLQTFLWYELPRRWRTDAGEQQSVAAALGSLLELLDLPRYAAVCRGAETVAVLAAWSRSETAGLKASRQAGQRSGVEPPDLVGHTDSFLWGPVRGPDEARAFHSTAAALELSLALGDLTPGAQGWRTRQRQLAQMHLTTARPELHGRSLRDLVHSERRTRWRRSRGEARQQIVDRVDLLLDDELPVPAGAADAVEPLRWLLAEAQSGLPLTGTGRLGRDVVVEAARRFGWCQERFPPRSEADLIELADLHVLARDLRAVRRHGPRLMLTARGRALLGDPHALWQAVAVDLAAGDTFDAFVTELALAVLLLDEACESDHLIERVVAASAGEGWRDDRTTEAPGRTAVSRVLWPMVLRAEVLGLMVAFGGLGEHTIALTLPGRGAALVALRARATGPAQHPG